MLTPSPRISAAHARSSERHRAPAIDTRKMRAPWNGLLGLILGVGLADAFIIPGRMPR
jgi:hypothetical protein